MNILIAAHNILDPGGIVNHTYHLKGGLEENRHNVTVALFTNSNDKITKTPFEYDQRKLPKDYVVGYKSGTNEAIKFIKKFDFVIWEVPVPTKMAANRGNNLWPELYYHNVPQIGVVHDGHIVDRTPWVYHVLDTFTALLPVHQAAATSCKNLSVHYELVPNPFDITEGDNIPFERRLSMFVSACNFKAMKHMEDLIEAIQYMDKKISKIIGGGGIEQCYMTSVDKCKDKYIRNGKKIWDTALENGMNYVGFLQNENRLEYYNVAKVMVDPSYMLSYCDKGGNFSRVFIEAMICGAIPVVRQEFTDINFFKPFVNYIPISIKSTPKQIAEVINDTVFLSKNEYEKIANNNYGMLDGFDRTAIAEKYISFYGVNGCKDSFLGNTSNEVIQNCNLNLATFFNIKVKRKLWF